MVDARRLLDALVGAPRQTGQPGGSAGGGILDEILSRLGGSGAAQTAGQVLGQATGGLKDAARQVDQSTGASERVGQAAGAAGVPSAGDLIGQAKGFFDRNPGMAQAAMGLAGLVLTSRQGRGVARNVAGLGGLALIGGLAYRALQNRQEGKPLLDLGGAGAPATPPAVAPSAVAPRVAPLGSAQTNPLRRPSLPPNPSLLDPASATEDDALLFVRAMVAAASADGHVDGGERERILKGLSEAGIDPDASRWLERELSEPADVDELAAGITAPEKAAQVYAAARLAIDADTLQEREFLRRLAEALDLDPSVAAEIDATSDAVKA